MGAGILMFVVGLILFASGLMSALSGDDNPAVAIQVTPTEAPSTTATFTPAPVTPAPPAAPPLGDSPYTMHIDEIGVNAPVETYGLDENQIPEVPTGANAAGLVAWYDFSARPGTGSNAVFAGHVTWNGRGVFYNLKTLTQGAEITLVSDSGTTLVYSVTDVFQVDPEDPESLKVMSGTPDDVITIITCDGAYSNTDDPVFGGEYSHRLVVRASLQSVTPG